MSLYSAMLAGVAGLQSNSTALAAISENIANVNTVGYKGTNIDFESLVTASTDNASYSAGPSGDRRRRPVDFVVIRYRETRPSERLRSFVSRFWILEHDGEDAKSHEQVFDPGWHLDSLCAEHLRNVRA